MLLPKGHFYDVINVLSDCLAMLVWAERRSTNYDNKN